jgi:hypothetical protein
VVAGLVLGLAPISWGMSATDSAGSEKPPVARKAQFSQGRSGSRLKWLPQATENSSKIVRTAYDAPATEPSGLLETAQKPKFTATPEYVPRPSATKKSGTGKSVVPSLNDGVDEKLPSEPKLPDALPGPNTEELTPSEKPLRPSLEKSTTPFDNLEKPKRTPDDFVPLAPPSESPKKEKPSIKVEQEFAPRQHEFKEGCPSPKDLKKISDLTTNITPSDGELPHDCPLGDGAKFPGRSFAPTTFTWTASQLCHKPLYFEDIQVERYGHMAGPWVQPFASAAHFFLTVPIVPYKMGLELPNECMYSLGYYRPGNCAPYMLDPLPISVRGAFFEAGAWVGGVFAFP